MAEDFVDGIFGKDSRDAELPVLPEVLPQEALVSDSGRTQREMPRGLELPFGVPDDLTTDEMLELQAANDGLPGGIVGRMGEDGEMHWRVERTFNEQSLR